MQSLSSASHADLRNCPWVDTQFLNGAVNRRVSAEVSARIWGGPAGDFLRKMAAEREGSTESTFADLLGDPDAQVEMGWAQAGVDLEVFPTRGRMGHPGPIGEYFLPVWIFEGHLSCVCHTPLLLPSPRALEALAVLYQVKSVSVAACLPRVFASYGAFLRKRNGLAQSGAKPETCGPEVCLERATRVDLEGYFAGAELLEIVPSGLQRKFEVIPVFGIEGRVITLAAEKVPDLFERLEINSLFPSGHVIRYVEATQESVLQAISAATATELNVNELAVRLERQGVSRGESFSVERIDSHSIHQRSISEDNAPAVTVLQSLLMHAVRNNASDLHIARSERVLHVEYRVDDWKCSHPEGIPVSFSEAVLARIKVLADLDLQRRTEPQFGKFVIDVANVGEVEVRVTIMPTVYGDAATLRFARRRERFPSLRELGLEPHEAGILERVIGGSYGMGLVVGPTGSGKSTTLYSVLAAIETDKYEVLSCEDPVERFLPGVKQTNVNRNLSYATYLAGALRADPDYIHIGETRTPDTAEQVLKAAETGHIVLTTLHTHQACAAPARLFGLGIEPYMLADTLSGVVAQHLLPKLCPHCEEAAPMPPEETLRALGIDPEWFGACPTLREGRGCGHCRGRGAHGRMLLAEGFHADSVIHQLVLKRRPLAEIREAQIAQGGRTLLQQAIHAAGRGVAPLSVAMSLGSSALA